MKVNLLALVKTLVKSVIRPLLMSDLPSVVVASPGRSGSTVIFEALVAGMAKKRFGLSHRYLKGLVRCDAWRLSSCILRAGYVYKTHDLPSKNLWLSNTKTVFVFGDVVDTVTSVISCQERFGREWVEEHLKHLNASGEMSDILDKDILRISEQLGFWFEADNLDLMLVHYEAIWEPGFNETLSKFVGFKAELPEFRGRSEKAELSDLEALRLNSTYSKEQGLIDENRGILIRNKARICETH